MKRRTFVTLATTITSSPVWASAFVNNLGPKGEPLEPGFHYQLFAKKSYRLPANPSLFETLIVSLDQKNACKQGPQILSSDQKILGETQALCLDEAGTYTVQFLGPEMGWHFY